MTLQLSSINPLAPVNVSWFQRELDQITRDHNLVLRLVWAPSLTVARIIDGGEERVYKKYPLIEDQFAEFVIGWRFHRRNHKGRSRVVGYQKVGELVPAHIRPTDFAIPHIERVHPSLHLWVIEKQLDDWYARRMHAQKRKLAQKELGIDLFGEFPKEGVWDEWKVLGEHRQGCCDIALSQKIRCRGLYRDPDETDLQEVRQAVAARAAIPASDQDALIEQAAKDIRAGMLDWERKQRKEQFYVARQIGRIAQRSIEKPAVYLDPAKIQGEV